MNFKYDSPFEEITAMDLYDQLSDIERNIVGWKIGMFGLVKTNKTLAKEFNLSVEQVDTIYNKAINFIKHNLE